MNSYDNIEGQIIQAKHSLYSIYYDLLGEIQDEKIHVDPKEYQKNIQTVKISKIIHIIKEAIQILLEKRVNNLYIQEDNDSRSNEEKLKDYEPILRYYEEGIKRQYKRIIRLSIQKEGHESNIDTFKLMEEDYEQQKEKLKYEDGNFLNNDRKDNEILILRAENCNLKSVIQKINKKQQQIDNNKKKSTDTIASLHFEIEKMTKKLSMIEHHHKDLSLAPGSSNNSSINININNLGNQASKWILQHEEENTAHNSNLKNSKRQCDSDRDLPLSERAQFEAKIQMIHRKKKTGQEKSAIVDSNAGISTYNRIMNELDEKIHKKSSHHYNNQKKNSSVGLQEKKRNDSSKYFSSNINNHPYNQTAKQQPNHNVNYNHSYVKLSNNAAPTSKITASNRTQKQYHYMGNTMNQIHMINQSGCKSANRSSLNIRSSSKGDN